MGEWGAASTVDAGHFQHAVAPVQTREFVADSVAAAQVGACGRRRRCPPAADTAHLRRVEVVVVILVAGILVVKVRAGITM